MSNAKTLNVRLLQYLIAFNDLHNFEISAKEYREILSDDWLNFKFPVDELNFSDLNACPANKFSQSQNMSAKVKSISAGFGWNEKNYSETLSENKKILEDYLTLCEENNCRAIMFLPPFPEAYKKHFSKQKLDEFYAIVFDAWLRHPTAGFLDGWQLGKYFSDDDFRDEVNLNIQGAKKFSGIFNNVILNLEEG